MDRIHAALKSMLEKTEDVAIQRALRLGWDPPEMEPAIEWWKERVRNMDVDELADRLIEVELQHNRDPLERIIMVLSFYQIEADDFLKSHLKGPITIVCPVCGSQVVLELIGGQDQNSYSGRCECGQRWVLAGDSE